MSRTTGSINWTLQSLQFIRGLDAGTEISEDRSMSVENSDQANLGLRARILVPITMMLTMQIASGLPIPDYYVLKSYSQELGRSFVALAEATSIDPLTLFHRILNSLHLPLFTLLTLLWSWSIPAWVPSRRRQGGTVLLICLSFGALNELSQLGVPTRLCTIDDGIANALGVVAGILLTMGVQAYRGSPNPRH